MKLKEMWDEVNQASSHIEINQNVHTAVRTPAPMHVLTMTSAESRTLVTHLCSTDSNLQHTHTHTRTWQIHSSYR